MRIINVGDYNETRSLQPASCRHREPGIPEIPGMIRLITVNPGDWYLPADSDTLNVTWYDGSVFVYYGIHKTEYRILSEISCTDFFLRFMNKPDYHRRCRSMKDSNGTCRVIHTDEMSRNIETKISKYLMMLWT